MAKERLRCCQYAGARAHTLVSQADTHTHKLLDVLCILSIFHANRETASVNLLMPSDTHITNIYINIQLFHLHNLSSIDAVNQSHCLSFSRKQFRARTLPHPHTIHEWMNECLSATFCYLFLFRSLFLSRARIRFYALLFQVYFFCAVFEPVNFCTLSSFSGQWLKQNKYSFTFYTYFAGNESNKTESNRIE